MAPIARGGGRPRELAGPTLDLVWWLLEAAVAAPSMHNTQPWRFRYRRADRAIDVCADPSRMLRHADAQGRAVHIACGGAVFNMRIAAAAAGREAVTRILPCPDDPLLLVTVKIAGMHRTTRGERELFGVIRTRHTSRSPFGDRQIPPRVCRELLEAARLQGAVLHMLDPVAAHRVLDLTAAADRAQRADPQYRAELAAWTGGQRASDGIPASALGPRALDGSLPVRDFGLGRPPAQAAYSSFETSPQLAVLSTNADGPVGWLRAGQALQRVLLLATARGIAVGMLTQALETADAWLVRDPRSGTEHPQMVLRLGYGAPAPATPRRPVFDVVEIVADDSQPA